MRHFGSYFSATLACVLLSAWYYLPSNALAQGKLSMEDARNRMVAEDVIGGGVSNPRVIQAMRDTPRHEFVDKRYQQEAYYDLALPIGEKQTISNPFVVAYMTEQLNPQPDDIVLEIGTGSGYQAAVLSPLVRDVYTIEIVEELGKKAARTLQHLKYGNVHVKIGDGYQGWTEHAPFDKIIVTCSPEKVPQPLVEQLKEGGRMIIPVGERFEQMLYLFTKKNGKLAVESLRPTLFVPMTGAAEVGREVQPDPQHPQITNGSFEELAGADREPRAWYFSRQMKVVEGADAPEGRHYVTFTNDVPGRRSDVLQGFAIAGQSIGQLEVSALIRGRKIQAGQSSDQLAQISFVFFDENWAITGTEFVGPFRDTFDWQRVTGKLAIPAKTSSCILHIGLMGGVGEFSIDSVAIRPLPRLGSWGKLPALSETSR
jgi:protein-L-isoaspartate(D-aspartate) O-methyltransferase